MEEDSDSEDDENDKENWKLKKNIYISECIDFFIYERYTVKHGLIVDMSNNLILFF